MNIKFKTIKIRQPDDWHVHLRDNNIMKTVLPFTSRHFKRAIIMPNLIPPITTIDQAISYKKRIINSLSKNHKFIPLMTCYLTESLNEKILINGFNNKIFFAAKLYFFNSTNNSSFGIKNISNIYKLLESMQKIKMPLLIHPEIINSHIDIFDREAYFIENIMPLIRSKFPELKIVIEHISTKESVDYILEGDLNLGATITPHHLMLDRNDMFKGGLRPHLYCFPIIKKKFHRNALRSAISSGCNRIFLGTDTAPHSNLYKESNYGLAGIFNSINALSVYIDIFEKINAIQYFESFCSINGPNFYNLPINNNFITLCKKLNKQPSVINLINNKKEFITPFLANKTLKWMVI